MTTNSKHKISIYISEKQAKAIQAMPRGINMSEKLRVKLDEILEEYDTKRD